MTPLEASLFVILFCILHQHSTSSFRFQNSLSFESAHLSLLYTHLALASTTSCSYIVCLTYFLGDSSSDSRNVHSLYTYAVSYAIRRRGLSMRYDGLDGEPKGSWKGTGWMKNFPLTLDSPREQPSQLYVASAIYKLQHPLMESHKTRDRNRALELNCVTITMLTKATDQRTILSNHEDQV